MNGHQPFWTDLFGRLIDMINSTNFTVDLSMGFDVVSSRQIPIPIQESELVLTVFGAAERSLLSQGALGSAEHCYSVDEAHV